MLSRILMFALVVTSVSAMASDKLAKLEIGIDVCEAYPEDCEPDSFGGNYYKLEATLTQFELTVKAKFTQKGSKSWTRKLNIATQDGKGPFVAQLRRLSRVQIIRSQATGVCDLLTTPAMDLNKLSTRGPNGKLREVLGAEGCWVVNRVYPSSFLEDAQYLKKELRQMAVRLAFGSEG